MELPWWLLSTAMVVGPIVGYIHQYFIIRKTKSSAGFNSITCAILLFANILRVFFWLGKRFDNTLLAQSIVMILAQLVLLEIVVRYRHDPSPMTLYANIRESFSSSSIQDDEDNEGLLTSEEDGHDRQHPYRRCLGGCLGRLWNWEHYLSYLNFVLAFTTIIAVLYLALGKFSVFIEILGALSLGIESMLPLPQLISNFRRWSTAGFSLLVAGTWAFGDTFKLFYFASTSSPLQFIVCGIIQVTIDCFIMLQFIVFNPRWSRFAKKSDWNDGRDRSFAVRGEK
ncbi:hypothetical protein BCR43DRAFT_483871 [Syncephalastrum racemosum]|uniref:PQ loop repeat-domain-containing protein n=1 Tax=Syncephalastrum racemosum TaxID=13706 RepID=A0A1X2HVV2_SYNRA|nr:hypothetical protein BCR43DRAFT_483871 [Syncephalastrum racemosum]